MVYIAHKKDNGEIQTVLSHLHGTATRCQTFAEAFGAGALGYRCGMLHDVGKYSTAFQRRINGANERVDHSTAGAREAWNARDLISAFCVAGHHGGLPEGGTRYNDASSDTTLFARVKRALPDYSAFRSEAAIPPVTKPPAFTDDLSELTFFTRMLYSCLVDADWLDTEAFMHGIERENAFPPLSVYRDQLSLHIADWLETKGNTLNGMRSEILRACIDAGALPSGAFSLTAPTGSGKTIASLAFALCHALQNGMRRVIYVIPYCSIIEQTQKVFESIFGEGGIVAHYANVEFATREDQSGSVDRRYLAAENWDAPIILTTNVQFFESLYASRPSRCRKLHNIANSVILFDEAQMLPVPFLRPCIGAVMQLIRHYGCSAVFCTATQPALEPLYRAFLPDQSVREICPRPRELYEAFRRVRYERIGKLSDEALAERMTSTSQALAIVNRRDTAQNVYRLIHSPDAFHLTTALCPADRRAILEEIRERLRLGKPCYVVSTCLIEAGVDVDFPVVYRALAGLDSIVQAGGRCNREGKRMLADSCVYVFESDRPAPRMLEQNVAAARYALQRFDDPASPEAIQAYFRDLLYTAKGMDALDEREILRLCADKTIPFRTVSDRFRLIDSVECTIYIPHKQNAALLDRLRRFGPNRSLLRQLGAYAVGVYPQLFTRLCECGKVERIADNAAVLTDETQYDPNTGLVLSIEDGQALFS